MSHGALQSGAIIRWAGQPRSFVHQASDRHPLDHPVSCRRKKKRSKTYKNLMPSEIKEAIDLIRAKLAAAKPDERIQIMDSIDDGYCRLCGGEEPPDGYCRCMNV
jgi:hypothetical protein